MSGGVPAGEIAKERADWLLDAVAAATQDRRYLRGDPEYDEWAGEAILLNGEKAILVAIDRATPTPPSRDADVERETAFLVALAEHGISPDVQELLVAGDGRGTVAPGALRKALRAALQALGERG